MTMHVLPGHTATVNSQPLFEERTIVKSGTVIVPLDGSHEATEAIPTAVALATRSTSRIVLLCAITAADLGRGDEDRPRNGLGQREHSLRRSQAEGYLAAIKNWIAGRGLEVSTQVEDGEIMAAILRAASETPGATVVVAARPGVWTWVGQLKSALESHGVPVVVVQDGGASEDLGVSG